MNPKLRQVFISGFTRGLAAPALIFVPGAVRAVQQVQVVEAPVTLNTSDALAAYGARVMLSFDRVLKRSAEKA